MHVVMRRSLAFLFLAFGAGLSAKPFALDPAVPMARYALASWRDTTGLPVDSVGAIAQTRNGYLWIATEHGLVRFDGVRFTLFTTANTPALRSNEIYSLFVSRDGTLWIGTRGGGAVMYDGTNFLRVPLPYRYVIGFAESGDGTLWIGAPRGITRLRDGRYDFFEKKEGYPGGELQAMTADANGIFLALPSGVMRMDGTKVETWTRRDGLPAEAVTSLLWTEDGLLAGSQGGELRRLANGRFEPFLRIPARKSITSILRGPRGSLWISTAGAGVHRFTGGRLSSLTEKDGLTSDSINQLLEDREGSMWAATTGGGLVQIRMPRLASVTPPHPLPTEWILPVLQARDGSIWYATNGGGVNHATTSSSRHYTTADGIAPGIPSAIAEDSDGAIWVGTHSSLHRIDGGRVSRSFTESDGLASTEVFAITPARAGGVWVSTRRGLHHIQQGIVRRLTEKEGFTENAVLSIRENADGSLWLARPLSVELVRDGKVTAYSREDGLQSRRLSSLTVDEVDGSLWVATMADGLYRIVDGKVRAYRARDGLLTDSLYAVIQDRRGNLWIPTGRGLILITRADIARFDAGKTNRLTTTVFRKSDGLRTNDFSGGFDRPGFRDSAGRLWFPTTRGIVVIDPDNVLADTEAPAVIIEDVIANGVSRGAAPSPIDPPRGYRQLEFAYAAPAFHSPESITFRYRLTGYDDEWTDAGTRRSAYFSNVPPGAYQFEVEAGTAEGRTTRTKTALRLEPRFYEDWPFRVAAALFVMLIVLVGHRKRVENLQRQQEELEASEEHFRSLIENAVDMILVLGRDRCVKYASPAVQRVLGFRPYRVNGREIGELLVEQRAADAFLDEVRREGHHGATLVFRDAMGHERQVEVIGSASDNGETTLNCRDITERRRLEAQLDQAERLSGLGRLAATVSHEFNNVLMGIQPFVDLIRRHTDIPAVHDSLSQINRSLQRGKRISAEILRYTRPAPPTLRPVPAREWLAGLETELRSLVGPHTRLALVSAPKLTLSIDAGQLNQVMANLALNARDAGASSVRIEATVAGGDGIYPFGIVPEPQRFAHIRFSDTGSGIPPHVLPKIFEPLFTTKSTRGTGLGLAVAQQVVSHHGGNLFVESTVGTGTTFHLFVPLGVAEEPEETLPEEDPLMPVAQTCRVLLVEDDPVVAAGILLLLEDQGFSTELAVTGAEALHAVSRFLPDVIVLDIGLPDIDGIAVYRQVMSRHPEMAVIFSTGHGDMALLEQTLGSADRPLCLQKPYSIEDLTAAINDRVQGNDFVIMPAETSAARGSASL